MTEATIQWFQELQLSLWEKKQGYEYRRGTFTYFMEARRLSLVEWERVKHILQEENPLTELVVTNFGFGCGINIYVDPEDPPYPGIPQEKPSLILGLTKDHLPIPKRRSSERLADRTYFEDGWEAFSPFTHTAENARRLVSSGFEAPKPKGYYEY